MKKKYLYILTLFLFTNCDAVNHISYSVENRTNDKIQLHVPNYSTKMGSFATVTIDTMLVLSPKEKQIIRFSKTDIDFPWASKTIYKEYPGICGLELISTDTTIVLKCDSKTWKYKRRNSNLKIN